jgi:hypothetical protein
MNLPEESNNAPAEQLSMHTDANSHATPAQEFFRIISRFGLSHGYSNNRKLKRR